MFYNSFENGTKTRKLEQKKKFKVFAFNIRKKKYMYCALRQQNYNRKQKTQVE